MSFWCELRERNVVKVGVAYAIVGWVVVQISDVLLPTFEAPEWVMRVLVLFIVIGFFVVLVVDNYVLDDEATATAVAGANGSEAAPVTGITPTQSESPDPDGEAQTTLPSVAVLPFVNSSPDALRSFDRGLQLSARTVYIRGSALLAALAAGERGEIDRRVAALSQSQDIGREIIAAIAPHIDDPRAAFERFRLS
ncbi:MAG: hypothetical protein PVF50_05525, partial [Gammaproteobacteria bacterium]